jgi:hypothetical protein
MKREDIEKAAKDYSIGKTYFRRNVLKEVDADNYVLRKGNCSEDFIAGAEWQAKQSPWISVEDKLPSLNQKVIVYKYIYLIGQKKTTQKILIPSCMDCRPIML